ncbi:MAG: multifunctional oxoglutarate decarboxylase/oxoglutarate dehydrogenase thiamine pyrophosphate-binding subunit/dihydrolipoyllysine-residue succinyltransferase subunit [Acidobacteria bacterium]|nr:multifunctional oxoglutarate decarboxylase/oxoglutarate dehydrogenase thiamine pyrophosphate-binding subunit/dihydrolipoyllysine-residue succinyltransferase subunit [Acidobacteriota bacterium]MCA1627436.1 multifunctional oxoglutarate decarboxylase/oxoglutarate dehydrogenase thiamine pyrophosphate-binding subunit/dihydrolipoyllysine-residue succinyltransferase subunit [Acidobacteriota bacterium]
MVDLSEMIAEEFGANAEYVQGMLERFRSNPDLVDDSWRSYFREILGDGAGPTPTSDNGTEAKVAEPALEPIAKPRAEPATETRAARKETTAAAAPAPERKPVEARPLADAEVVPLRGPALKIVENMESSLRVPTATSERRIPVKLLDENRRLINQHLAEHDRGKASYTHLTAWALLRALEQFPQLNDGFFQSEGGAARLKRPQVNLGVAVDLTKKDGTRTLLVPNIKNANSLSFSEFLTAYDDVVKRARDGKLQIADFQGTTLSLTNPGTIGTVASIPRLMEGQSLIVATGAIEYPAEYQAMAAEALSQLGVSKTITISNTYDHRIIQGAESGAFLARVHELIIGKHEFYDTIFADLGIPHVPFRWNTDRNPFFTQGDQVLEQSIKEARVIELINAYRVRGHLIADVDPLHALPRLYHPELDLETYGLTIWDLDRVFTTDGLANKQASTLREILDVLQRAYCGKVGIEYRHIQSKEEKTWIREQIRREFVEPEPLPGEVKKKLLWKLISAEQFERFLHTKYLGQKRFSLEGCETVIPLLDRLIDGAGERGVEEIVFGMAHRGRLNVLANVIGNLCERIFAAFEGSVHPEFPADEGDVKYHQGATGERTLADDRKVQLSLSPNPSHLEAVDPVVEGMVRAKQDEIMGQRSSTREEVMDVALPVLLHGDAAFAGQGVVMETLNLAGLKGYRTGGTIHIIINNQIGFTTSPEAGRSTIYSTDVARMTQLPIFHINGDDPEAAYRVLQIALNYRQEFNKDVVLDVVGFRRLGHNETDEPSYTQPLMYARVKAHPGVRALYAKRLIKEGVVTEEEVNNLIGERVRRYEDALANAKRKVAEEPAQPTSSVGELDGSEVIPTGVDAEKIRSIAHKIAVVPEGFNVNPKMVGQLARRAKMGDGQLPLDWAFAEAAAFGSLVLEGTRVRLSGQDSGRGTFSQRHAVLYDTQSGKAWAPLSELRSETNPAARFEVFDSSLSEEGVLGFEYGYSVVNKDALVLWEAQFGDFGNGAQTIIDQYIAASEDKWKQTSRVVMLLPHGYEGQGPEHSSARLERYLQLCAENNLQVCYPTTPAQYFHLLRRQVRPGVERPLVVMTPKSLLRLPAAASLLEDLASGGFRPVIDDAETTDAAAVRRVVFCSGKVYYDLMDARKQSGDLRVAIVRLEQFYPFPQRAVQEVLAKYASAAQFVWAQEEPHNMGGWAFVRERLESLLSDGADMRYVGRGASASPATGSYSIHQKEQAELVAEALGIGIDDAKDSITSDAGRTAPPYITS